MADRLPELDAARLHLWMTLLEARAGMVIPVERKSFLEAGLRARMQQIGVADYDAYYRLLSTQRHWTEEWSLLVDRLTVHETSFFRHAPSLRLLTDEILPTFAAANPSRGFQAWSVGCASGEEPYTLAMLMHQFFTEACRGRLYGVTGTDISLPSLQIARAGIYSARRAQAIPAELRERFCADLGDDTVQMRDELRRRVCFAQLNVLRMGRFPLRNLDLIYCQNMLIYIPRHDRPRIIETLIERLAPQGVLVLAPGDLACWSHPQFARIRFEGTLAFRRQAIDRASA
ncbi:MAG: protein-glutamate O-methyltransferase CheR [Gammaproteobacteria bacterium]